MFPLGRHIPPPTGDYQWVYLWGGPLRFMHWIAVFAILALIVTGLYIGRPYFVTVGGPPHYLMG